MKALPPSLASLYQAETATLARFALFTRLDGTSIALTSCDVNVTVAGTLYRADPGLTKPSSPPSTSWPGAGINARCSCSRPTR